MNLRFIDTHCHVHFEAYKNDMEEVVKRNLEEGIGMITIGTQSSTSKNGIALAEKYDGVWCTIGLHPNHLHKQEFFDANELPEETADREQETGIVSVKTRAESFDPDYYRELVRHPKVVAIGEFGLDYYRLPPDTSKEQMIADQKEACRAQLRFASEFDKPIVIHCRDAHDDQIELLREEIDRGGLKKRGVIHSFTGTAEEAARYRELGFILGINGILTFSKDLQRELQNISLDQIVLETDSPYLAPPPHRGERNEPRFVVFVAEKIAEIKGVTVDEVVAASLENTKKTFGIDW